MNQSDSVVAPNNDDFIHLLLKELITLTQIQPVVDQERIMTSKNRERRIKYEPYIETIVRLKTRGASFRKIEEMLEYKVSKSQIQRLYKEYCRCSDLQQDLPYNVNTV